MPGPIILYWTLVALLVYSALLAMRLRHVRHVYFLVLKQADKQHIDITLNSLTPLLYWRRYHYQSIRLSIRLGLFVLEATGQPGDFKYAWITIHRLLIGVRRNSDGTTDGSIKLMKSTFQPGRMYETEAARKTS
jgi:hypothetical protein